MSPAHPRLDIPSELVARVRAGDVAAFDALVRMAFAPLVRFAYGILKAQDIAEDVVQEVLARVWERRERWQPSGAAMAYLLAMVRNESLKALRRRAVEIRHQAQVQQTRVADQSAHHDWIPDDTTSRLLGPEELLLWREQMHAFDAVLSALTERQRSAFVLRYEQGLTVPAIATVLGVSVKGAEKLVSRVTHLLRERLQDVRYRD